MSSLQQAGYPTTLLNSVAANVLKNVKNGECTAGKSIHRMKRPVVISQIHNISHNLKTTGNRGNVDVLFSAPNILLGLCKKR